MPRWITTTAILALIAAWASAQGNSSPIAAERLRLFHRNQDLLEKMIERTIQLSQKTTSLERAKVCKQSTIDLSRELASAVDRDDADRVSELGEYLTTLLSDGVQPTLGEARDQIPAGSPHWQEMRGLHASLVAEAERIELSIPRLGRVGSSERVNEIRRKLNAARQQLTAMLPAE